MKVLIFLVFTLISNVVSACFIPNAGAEFDRLIEVSKSKEKNTYHISLPRQLNDSWVRYIGVQFQKKESVLNFETKETTFEYLTEYEETLYSHSFFDYFKIINRNKVNIIYKAKYKEGYIQKIIVAWPTELCWTYANSKKLGVQ